jgi:hypothetical protein
MIALHLEGERMASRREFLQVTTGLGAGWVLLIGCGDDGGGSTGTDAGSCAASATIGSNHGHTINVSQADVDAAVDKTYDIAGTAGHNHTVTVTATGFRQVRDTGSFSVESSTDAGHEHLITITCV